MPVAIELPKAFSVRDERELPLIQDLIARLNPKLLAALMAMGVHVNGGPTVHWGIVYLEGQCLSDDEIRGALEEAGMDFQHNTEIALARAGAQNRV
jgi:hypothetical protein